MSAAPILKILKDGEMIRSCPLGDEAIVGRGEGCVIRLEDRAISRQHALFRRVGDGIQVEKKSEFAPLIVNGTECTRAVLKEGDVIALGPYLLKLASEKVESSTTAPVEAAAPEIAPAPSLEPEPIPAAAPDSVTVPIPEIEAPSDEALQLESEQPEQPVQFEEPAADTTGPVLESPALESPDAPLLSLENPLGDQGEPAPPLEVAIPPMEGSDPSSEFASGTGETKVLSASKVDATLRFKSGDANVTEYQITKDETVIGRGKDCDIVLNDKKSSRRNTAIIRAGARFILKDLGSSNGTYLNRKKIVGETLLAGEETIRIGDVEFEFNAGQADYDQKQRDFLPVPDEEEEIVQDAFPPMGIVAAAPDAGAVSPEAMAAAAQAFVPASTDGIAGIAGISPSASAKKGTLLEKFRALPKSRQYIAGACIVALLYFAFFDEDDTPAPARKGKPKTAQVAGAPGAAKDDPSKQLPSFAALTPEQKKFVEAQHDLAFSYYKNRDYDKAIFEIEKIFSLVSDYKDSREIERYAKEGKRKLEALAEEKRQQEEEAALKKRIADLIADGRDKMDKKKYDEAGQVFSQILALDPENAQVAAWQKQIQDAQESKKIDEEKREVAKEVNRQAWGVYHEGLALMRKGRFRTAIAVFDRARKINAGDDRVARLSDKMIRKCHEAIYSEYKPLLDEGKQSEDNGDYLKALELYEKALALDPESHITHENIGRIKGVLHERAKALYTEAVLAESYSDFTTARKKFKDCLQTAPADDIYHGRAERKLGRYFKTEVGSGT